MYYQSSRHQNSWRGGKCPRDIALMSRSPRDVRVVARAERAEGWEAASQGDGFVVFVRNREGARKGEKSEK